MTLYHGTDYKQEILKNGFQDVNYHPNGTHFGKGIYLTENLAYAGCFGDDILRVAIDESKLIIFNLLILSIFHMQTKTVSIS